LQRRSAVFLIIVNSSESEALCMDILGKFEFGFPNHAVQ